MATKAADKQPVAPQQSADPQIKWKHELTFRHDLYKLKVAVGKRNNSWQTGVLRIDDIEHCHVFHSHDSKGHPNQYSSATMGHFHEVTVEVDPVTGEMKGKCGPALKMNKTRLKSGAVRKGAVPVAWADEQRQDNTPFVDGHTHEVEYRGSEQISVNARKANAKAALAMSLMQPKPTHLQIKEQ